MIVLVGCGARKLTEPAPARELYTGSLFRTHLRMAEALAPQAIYVLSAKYGVVGIDAELEPYQLDLKDMPRADHERWLIDVATRVEELCSKRELVVVLAGARYLEWRACCSRHVVAPLAGMTLGERRGVVRALCGGSR